MVHGVVLVKLTERDGFVLLTWNQGSLGAGDADHPPAAGRRGGSGARSDAHPRSILIFLGLSFFGGGFLGCAISLLAQA